MTAELLPRLEEKCRAGLLIEDTIEDTETATLHRPDCGEVDQTHRLELHRAGALLTRPLAPKTCRAFPWIAELGDDVHAIRGRP